MCSGSPPAPPRGVDVFAGRRHDRNTSLKDRCLFRMFFPGWLGPFALLGVLARHSAPRPRHRSPSIPTTWRTDFKTGVGAPAIWLTPPPSIRGPIPSAPASILGKQFPFTIPTSIQRFTPASISGPMVAPTAASASRSTPSSTPTTARDTCWPRCPPTPGGGSACPWGSWVQPACPI
jgi:hypothetical protein